MDAPSKEVSGFRLRLGVFFIVLFWLPVWLLAPTISDMLGFPIGSQGARNVLIAIMLIQTVFGVIGALITGRTIFFMLKSVPRKKVPKAFWYVLKTGRTDMI